MRKIFTMLLVPIVTLCAIGLSACSKGGGSTEDPVNPNQETPARFVTGVVLEAEYEIEEGDQITLTGNGFGQNDYLLLRTADNDLQTATAKIETSKFTFNVPGNIVSGTQYKFVLRRGNLAQNLGAAKITIKEIVKPDDEHKNATITGKVLCGTEPVVGALVSDGTSIVETDAEGNYWIESKKKHGSVFVIVPSGYEVATVDAMPQFWQKLTKDAKELERHDFALTKRENDNFKLLVATDMHLANRNSDVSLFTTGWVGEVTAKYNASATPVYCLNLGDFAWDLYWYQNKYDLNDAKSAVSTLKFQFWSAMGNHDNNGGKRGDWDAEQAYRDIMGPVFYSTNIGKAHIIMCDDTVYKNEGSGDALGIVGDRKYDKYFTEDNINFIREDLKHVDKSTPILVGFHCPLYYMSYSVGNWKTAPAWAQSRIDEFVKCFDGYNVTFMSGHTHFNCNNLIPGYESTMKELNVAAVCGTWWWSCKYASRRNVCTDGSPAGYKVFDFNGTNYTYYYKGVGIDEQKQFQTYDMNSFMTWWTTDSKAVSFRKNHPKYDSAYSMTSTTSNDVFINVWAYEPSWKVEVFENGKSLTVSRVCEYDPLHMAHYDVPRYSGNSGANFMTEYTSHLFCARAKAAGTTLKIRVTDSFGKTYEEEMTRPKAFVADFK